jgi:SpoVK/Ycf46/Vps4 family AAA+-type ATPase
MATSANRDEQDYYTQLDPVSDIDVSSSELYGENYLSIMEKVRKIISHQQNNQIRNGIPGFIFYGPPGTGKTTMVKAIAKDLMSELFFVDGANVARALYGQSEQAIVQIFSDARKTGRDTIVLIDDAESVFPSREWQKGQAWHVAQNNVFFHQIDDMDTSEISVVLTTNKIDMMDEAVIDRLLNFEFEAMPMEVLVKIAENRSRELQIESEEIVKKIRERASDLESVRDVEKIIWNVYVEQI